MMQSDFQVQKYVELIYVRLHHTRFETTLGCFDICIKVCARIHGKVGISSAVRSCMLLAPRYLQYYAHRSIAVTKSLDNTTTGTICYNTTPFNCIVNSHMTVGFRPFWNREQAETTVTRIRRRLETVTGYLLYGNIRTYVVQTEHYNDDTTKRYHLFIKGNFVCREIYQVLLYYHITCQYRHVFIFQGVQLLHLFKGSRQHPVYSLN